MKNKYKIYISLYILHNVKEKEAEFGHASVPGEKKKNKHMLVVSDTSFCSNNFKNVCFIFKTKFRWHSLDAAVETVSLFFGKNKKASPWPIYSSAATQKVPVLMHSVCSPGGYWGIFSADIVGASLSPQMLLGIRTAEGLHQLSCDEVHGSPALLKARPISHGTQWIFTESFGDLNLLTTYWWSLKAWCAKKSEQLTLVTSYIRIYGSNHRANELRSWSTSSGAGRFVGGQCKTPTDAYWTQIKTQLLKNRTYLLIFSHKKTNFKIKHVHS